MIISSFDINSPDVELSFDDEPEDEPDSPQPAKAVTAIAPANTTASSFLSSFVFFILIPPISKFVCKPKAVNNLFNFSVLENN